MWITVALAGQLAGAHMSANLELGGQLYAGTDTQGRGMHGAATALVHPLRPIRVDDTPRALRPFVQRVSSVGLTAGGSLDVISSSTNLQSQLADIGVVADFTLPFGLVLGGALGVREQRFDASLAGSANLVYPGYGQGLVGWRFGDLRVDVAYAPQGQSRWQYGERRHEVTLRARAVLDRRWEVAMELERHEGAHRDRALYGVTARVGWFPRRDLGVTVEGTVQSGAYWSGSSDDEVSWGASLRGSWWPTEALGLDATWSTVEEVASSATYVRHMLRLGATARFASW